jgi:hypothetical protein
MTDWWEIPYRGGPMVAVKGFPRPLYPPDARDKGKNPSADGPDIEAIKRTVSRAGRWKWQQFDQAYSNGFAHGTDDSVINSGVEGIQRQQNIDPTGWIGEATFNTLRSIRCPQGSHEGEMAMDARAVELINAAWDIYKGNPDPPPSGNTSAKARLNKAISYLGTKENPSNSNNTEFGAWYGMNGVPWCAIFCTYCDQMSGNPTNSFARGSRYSYVPYIVNDARMGYNGLSITSSPKQGDMVCYDWDNNGEFDHVGFFEAWTTSPSFNAIEGNTSMSDNSNGGEVMRRLRNKNSQNTVFVRVAE